MLITAAFTNLRPMATAAAIHFDLADKQRRWVNAVLIALGNWTATQLAREAKISPSTLTRFLNKPEHPGGLHSRTIARIEGFTGYTAYEMPSSPSAGFFEPDAERYDEGGASSSRMGAAVAALIGRSNARIPWVLKERVLETVGFLPGDVLIVDLNRRPAAGDIVCAQVYDWTRPSRTVTVFRVFNAPVLVAATLDPRANAPLMVDDKTVAIKGVVVDMVRGLRPD